MIAIRIVGAAVLVVAVAFVPAHVLLHGDEVSVSLLIWSGAGGSPRAPQRRQQLPGALR